MANELDPYDPICQKVKRCLMRGKWWAAVTALATFIEEMSGQDMCGDDEDVSNLGLSIRTRNLLERCNVETIGELRAVFKSPSRMKEFSDVRQVGGKVVEECRVALQRMDSMRVAPSERVA